MINSLYEPHIRPESGNSILTRIAISTTLLATALLAVFGARACPASPFDYQAHSVGEILLAQRAIADTVPTPPPPPPLADPGVLEANDAPPPAKSPGRAFLLNMLVPGTGHLYAGNKRGWIHLGLEGATWVSYLYYHDRGKTKEDEFEAYADNNWDYQRWKSESQLAGTYTSEADQLISDFAATNRQQYYEDIGKLPIYWTGWQDFDAATGDAQSRRFYRGVRNDSNNFLKNARYAVVGGFVNRIVSAVDVLRLVKNRGRANLGADTSIKFNMRTRPFSNENALKVTLSRRLY
jgi:hypothetical protein